ncbi:MAG: DUF3450 domain-containing protein [Gammaproteobacteria bacterium]|nr:DUF3450 domain-containing protein [Gammaproteobacteria bacterium]MDH3767703.1 DUF3450 domain-containing protein [Gammaproteobacteria bacterium]
MEKNSPSPVRAVPLALTLFLVASLTYAQGDVARTGAQTQIDQLSRQSVELLEDYRVALQSLDQVRIYNQHLQQVIIDQEASRAKTAQQLENYERSKGEIVPLMSRMIDALDKFVELDLPFHLDERRNRVQVLKDNMVKSEISISEKFRRVLDAYQIEMNFGRDMDATTGWLESDSRRREVSYLRVGRIVLAYQTHDRSETGFFNPVTREWEVLPDEYRNFVTEGLRIANKQAAPVLLKLPVAAPEAAQ